MMKRSLLNGIGHFRKSHKKANFHTGKTAKSKCNDSPILPRQLIKIDCHNSSHCDVNSPVKSISIRIASYNVLAQCQLANNRYLYNHCDPDMLHWDYRQSNLLKEITEIDADILCMQEVEDEHYEKFFKPQLSSLGYLSFYNQKTRNKKDGISISFKEDKFNLISSVPVNYYQSDTHAMLNSDNVGLLLLLQPKENGKKSQEQNNSTPHICIANTHFFFNPNRGDIKLGQLCLLLQEIDRLTHHPDVDTDPQKRCPILFCGDFNAEPNSLLLNFVLTGRLSLDDAKVSEISSQNETSFMPGSRLQTSLSGLEFPHPLNKMIEKATSQKEMSKQDLKALRHGLPRFFNAYSFNQPVNKPRLVTSYTCKGTCAVDYILYTHSCREESSEKNVICHGTPYCLCLQSYLSLLSPKQLHQASGLPNWRQSSDHIPLVANFALHFNKPK